MNDVAPSFYAVLEDWQFIGDVVKAILRALYDGIA